MRGVTPIRLFIACCLSAGVTAMSAHADSVRLKTSLRLASGADAVHLRDIAELEGPEAEAHRDLVVAVVRRTDRPMEIDVREVRRVLDEAGVHWGRLNLTGNKVIVRPPSRSGAAAPVAMSGASLLPSNRTPRKNDRAAAPARRAAVGTPATELVGSPTLRGTIARRFVQDLDVAADAVRLVFDAADNERLDRTDERLAWEITPEGNLQSDRVTITVRAWSDGRVAESFHVSVRPQLHRRTAILARDVHRDELLSEADITIGESWLPPSQVALTAQAEDVDGRFITKSSPAGTVLRTQLLRKPTLVDRGDRVIVRCRVGGVVLSLQAEARADGVAGETIEFRKLGERNTFLATVTARGEAALDLGL